MDGASSWASNSSVTAAALALCLGGRVRSRSWLRGVRCGGMTLPQQAGVGGGWRWRRPGTLDVVGQQRQRRRLAVGGSGRPASGDDPVQGVCHSGCRAGMMRASCRGRSAGGSARPRCGCGASAGRAKGPFAALSGDQDHAESAWQVVMQESEVFEAGVGIRSASSTTTNVRPGAERAADEGIGGPRVAGWFAFQPEDVVQVSAQISRPGLAPRRSRRCTSEKRVRAVVWTAKVLPTPASPSTHRKRC